MTAAAKRKQVEELKTVVVGAGSWGTAFAQHLASIGFNTTLLARRPEQAETMARRGRNPDYLDFLDLSAGLSYGVYPDGSVAEADLVLLAVPSRVYGEVLESIGPLLRKGTGLLSLTKGLDPSSGLRLSEVASARLSDVGPAVAVLSGPNQAEEVALGQPTATVIASQDQAFAKRVQHWISNQRLRAYVNRDVVGVELAGAVKNVVALATGMSDGLGYGDNARAALVTRGLAEMARLGLAMGAEATTFSGLAGLGDLVGTCTSRHSRNRMAGQLIAQGFAADSVEAEMGMIAEGLTSAPVIRDIARAHDVEMPITENVVSVISEGKSVSACVRDLMTRRPRAEAW